MERVRKVGGRCQSSQVQPAGAAGGPGQPTGNTHRQLSFQDFYLSLG